jgi:hypothetical protein
MRFVSARAGLYLGLAVAYAYAAMPAFAALPEQAATPGNPMPAVWKEQHLDFFYRGRTAQYSCDGLRDKVRALLIDLGARRDVKIVPIGCHGGAAGSTSSLNLPSLNLPSLNLIFSAPALPDAAAKPLHVGDLAATDARFEPFTIASDAFRNMGIGDCELVEEFARQVLPKLVARGVRQDIACVLHQQSGSRFLVRGEILKTLPRVEQRSLRER